MKYIDIYLDTEKLGRREIIQITKEFVPDIIATFKKRGRILDSRELFDIMKEMLHNVVRSVETAYKRTERNPAYVRLIMKITKNNKVRIFFVPYSEEDKLMARAKYFPILIIGADSEDLKMLDANKRRTDIGILGHKPINNN